MKLKIIRRWGSNLPGDTVTVDDMEQARWLLDNSFAERSNQPGTAYGNAAAPGEAGPDPRAGGDHTRRYPATIKGDWAGVERASAVTGSPKQYNAGVAAQPAGPPAAGSGSTQDSDEAPKTRARRKA